MKNFLLILLPLFVIGLNSCKSEDERKAEALEKEVLELHDTLMVKTEKISKLKRDLLERRGKTTSIVERKALNAAAQLLASGESFMYDWMDTFEKKDVKKAPGKAVKYYEEQLKTLERMDREMDKAIKKGMKWLEKLESR